MSISKDTSLVLAFDIERSGATNKYDTIGIGASVVDTNLHELDSLFLPGYFEKDTIFESRCWNEFWSKNLDALNLLKYTGTKNKKERELEMITHFQTFRKKWPDAELVSDNNVFDGGFINDLIFNYLDDNMPIPYKNNQYSSFWETHSQQRGLLMIVDPEYKGDYDFSKRIAKLYNIPDPQKQHDHNPANDAYTIAYDQQILLGIRDGRYVLREKKIYLLRKNK